jgi:hypothetical protein
VTARSSSLDGGTLSRWLEDEGIVPAEAGAGSIADVAHVRTVLLAAAREGRAVSYSELLRDLGHRFTRPKMRAVCKTLDAVDREAATKGEPALAVLVVRESDRLPGQGWWTGARQACGYDGAWDGPQAAGLIRELQGRAFDYWRER